MTNGQISVYIIPLETFAGEELCIFVENFAKKIFMDCLYIPLYKYREKFSQTEIITCEIHENISPRSVSNCTACVHHQSYKHWKEELLLWFWSHPVSPSTQVWWCCCSSSQTATLWCTRRDIPAISIYNESLSVDVRNYYILHTIMVARLWWNSGKVVIFRHLMYLQWIQQEPLTVTVKLPKEALNAHEQTCALWSTGKMWCCIEIMVSLAHWNPEKLSIYVLVASISGEIFFYLTFF